MEAIGRYEIIDRLGGGGMGVVYRARDSRLRRLVALKFIRIGHSEDSEEYTELVDRFRVEAQAAAALSHPNIVTVHDFAEEDGRPYLVMEYVEGSDLSSRMRKGRVSLADTLRILDEGAGALDHAHGRGVLHRDIKPPNLLLGKEGNVKLTDFGIARIAGLSSLTSTGQLVGTPHYMSPELLEERAPPSARSDQYSLGVVAYELLALRKPFEADSFGALCRRICATEAPALSLLPQAASERLDSVFKRVLDKSPENRFPNCSEFAGALRQACSGENWVFTPAEIELAETEEDAREWRAVQDSNNPADFEQFLIRCPTNKFAGHARQRIQDLHEEFRAWQSIEAAPDSRKVQEFTLRYPNGALSQAAMALKTQLDAESGAWAAVRESVSAGSIADFLRQYPGGAYARDAQARLEELAWQAVRLSTETPPFDAFLAQYPSGPFTGAARHRLRNLQLEAEFWGKVEADGNVQELRDFVEAFPDGHYAQTATRLLGLRERATAEWQSLQGSYDLGALASFVARYPHGPHSKAAQDWIETVKAEQRDWQAVHASEDPAALSAFLVKYPGTPRLEFARSLISSLRIVEEEWRLAERMGNPGAVASFIKRNSQSRLIPVAKAHLGELNARAQRQAEIERDRERREQEQAREQALQQALASSPALEQLPPPAVPAAPVEQEEPEPSPVGAEQPPQPAVEFVPQQPPTAPFRRIAAGLAVVAVAAGAIGLWIVRGPKPPVQVQPPPVVKGSVSPPAPQPGDDRAWQALGPRAALAQLDAFIRTYPASPHRADVERRSTELRLEQQEWDFAKAQPTAAALQSYLARHPNGQFADNARLLLVESQNEENAWKSIKDSKDPKAIEYFLTRFPKSPNSQPARQRLQDIQREETTAWNAAKEAEEQGPLVAYLSTYPAGRFTAEANRRLISVRVLEGEWTKIGESRDERVFQDFMTRYPRSSRTKAAQARIERLRAEATVAWSAIKDTRSQGPLEDFIGKYPGNALEGTAADRLSEIRRELASWNAVKDSTDPAAVQRFADSFPKSTFLEAAQQKVRDLAEDAAWKGSESSDNPASLEKFLASYPNGRYSKPAQARLTELRSRKEAKQPSITQPPPAPAASNEVNAKDQLRYVWIRRDSGGFRLAATEVTVQAFERFVSADPARQMPKPSTLNPAWKIKSYPMINVAFGAAQEYCRWIGGRLPTETEWQYAAQGAKSGPNVPGVEMSHNDANFFGKGAKGERDLWDYLAPVGSFPPNDFGLLDMAGNVQEWVLGPGGLAVLRGGHYNSGKSTPLVSAREEARRADGANSTGFRCAW